MKTSGSLKMSVRLKPYTNLMEISGFPCEHVLHDIRYSRSSFTTHHAPVHVLIKVALSSLLCHLSHQHAVPHSKCINSPRHWQDWCFVRNRSRRASARSFGVSLAFLGTSSAPPSYQPCIRHTLDNTVPCLWVLGSFARVGEVLSFPR